METVLFGTTKGKNSLGDENIIFLASWMGIDLCFKDYVLWNYVYKSRPLDPGLSQLNPPHKILDILIYASGEEFKMFTLFNLHKNELI
jgi:hypothetical protein